MHLTLHKSGNHRSCFPKDKDTVKVPDSYTLREQFFRTLLFRLLLEHRHLYALFPSYFPRCRVPCIRMPHDPYSWISSQYPFEFTRGLRCSIGDETHSRVNAVAHSDTAALMHAHPSRTCSRVQQRVQDRPISDSITTIKHTFGLSTRRSNAPTVEMIPSNPDRPGKFSICH